MLFQAHLSPALTDFIPPGAAILRECLSFTPGVAFKKASHRRLLGMGQPGAAGRPETFPQQVAA